MTDKNIYSMTGFARVAASAENHAAFTLSLKSVNHRFLDLHLQLPSNFDNLEAQVRRVLKDRLRRGHVELRLSLDRTASTELQYNRTIVAAYVAAVRAAASEHGLSAEPDLNAAFRLPGALSADSSLDPAAIAAIESAVLAQLDPLIDALNLMRAQEGAALAADLRQCMARLDSAVAEVSDLRAGIQQAHTERIAQRMAEVLAAGNANLAPDPNRILQEAALLAERSDVTEEIVRLRTHIQHFLDLLSTGGETGKKLDFLLQEMNREANTLLSKSGGIAGSGLSITTIGLTLKSEIEKARDQIQNLE